MIKYKDALNDLQLHATKQYHLLAGQRVKDFLSNYNDGGKKDIDILLNNRMNQVIEYNQKRLIPIIKTVLFCAQNNLPLRGHRESGSLKFDDIKKECLSGKQGVFRALLSFRIEAGDTNLETHLDAAPKNCTMISPSIQNEIVETIGDIIKKKIVDRVKASKYYSILCDETTDISTKEQMTICVRYVDNCSFVIREDFLGFVELTSTTGISIRDVLKNELDKVGLSFDFLRGQGYDGGSNMSGRYNGVQALVQQEQPLAFYTHCFNHSLNLCLSKSCGVTPIQNMSSIVGAVSTFFSLSAKRTERLKHFINTGVPNENNNLSRKTKLKKLAETRWVDRHDSLITFKELYIYIVRTLEDLQHDSNPETSSKSLLYVSAITKSDFLVSLEVSVTCFSYTLNLSQSLQSKQQDLSKALTDISIVRQALEAHRDTSDQSFKEIMNNVTMLASQVGVEISTPRTCGRQTMRINVDAKDPEEYYKISIFIPFLDNLIQQLHSRFDHRLKQIIALEGLIPFKFGIYDDESIFTAASVYENDFSVSMKSCLKAELFIWKKQWESNNNPPKSAIESIQHCSDLLPNIKTLLQLFATLPVTSATPERTFSVLKRLKTYLRATMTEDRLNGFALANINKNDLEYIDVEKDILPAFMKRSPRRMKILDWTI